MSKRATVHARTRQWAVRTHGCDIMRCDKCNNPVIICTCMYKCSVAWMVRHKFFVIFSCFFPEIKIVFIFQFVHVFTFFDLRFFPFFLFLFYCLRFFSFIFLKKKGSLHSGKSRVTPAFRSVATLNNQTKVSEFIKLILRP